MTIYILSMERYGDREGHHYNCGAYTDLAQTTIEGLEHERYRDNKYTMHIELVEVNDHTIKEVPREVAINYAIARYPERFNDKKAIKG